MKLIRRTNLFLIALVILQAFLAYNFLTISLVNFSQKDGLETIDNDFETIRSHYNNYKDLIWQDIVHMDNKLPRLLAENPSADLKERLPLIMELIKSEDPDYLIVNRGETFSGINIKHPFTEVPFGDLPFVSEKWHPALSVRRTGDKLYMIGSLLVDEENREDEPPLVINVLKEMSNRFSKDLTYNTSAGIILYSEGTALSGTLDPDYYFTDILNLDSRRSEGRKELHFFDIPFYGKSYNILLAPIDTLYDKETEISIALFSPNLSIKQRFNSIKNQFLIISIICVALAMFISLFISRSISKPVQELGRAMGSLKKGYYPKVEPVNTATEIHDLYSDFNSMVDQIKYNSSQQIALIQEITFLKTYTEQIVESIQEGIAIIDKTGHLNLMNRAFYDFCPQLKGTSIPHVREINFWDETLEKNLSLIRDRAANNFACTSRNSEGKLFDIRLYPLQNTGYDRSTENSSILMLEDITAREKMESQLLQVEKLNSLSILTAGVAHEINNPLGSIMANVENLNIVAGDSESRTSVQWIKREIRRIAGIIKGLMDFTGSGRTGMNEAAQAINWPDRINHYMKYALKDKGEIRFNNMIGDMDFRREIPEDELLQVLINLLNNSIQALDQGGTIEICSRIENREDSDKLIIEVLDDGPGIPSDIRNRVFDPFFTTKPVGMGTGLGLSIVYGLINKYNGSVEINNRPERGCAVTLIIPGRKGE